MYAKHDLLKKKQTKTIAKKRETSQRAIDMKMLNMNPSPPPPPPKKKT